ncbi:uncharacterized protein RSE6_11793 [Rhynchosporium secalis]|uniref:Uncharacterized protein n=1 Tax=Rhynchosporium secalis TaxID=38038 RepID=A0A1E1MNW9_RHYSE|nr:uncharacterized protein RSE6_11793 [Rhynchosporium secalis]
MVLVRHEISVRAKALQDQSSSNAGSGAETASAQVSLSVGAHASGAEAHASALQLEPKPTISSSDRWDQSSRWSSRADYRTQLALLEKQNKERLLATRKEQQQRMEHNKRVEVKGSEDTDASSREDYQVQHMALELESAKRLMGTRPKLPATLGSGSRNQGHDAQSAIGGYRTQAQLSQLAQLRILEEEEERRLAVARDRSLRPNRHDDPVMEFYDRGNRNDYRSAPQDIPTKNSEFRGREGISAGQDVTSRDETHWVALEGRHSKDSTTRSQTEVEFGNQRSRYLTEEAEMSRFSGQNLPGAPGSSCSPPEFITGHSLRAVPRPDVESDDMYDC